VVHRGRAETAYPDFFSYSGTPTPVFETRVKTPVVSTVYFRNSSCSNLSTQDADDGVFSSKLFEYFSDGSKTKKN